MPPSSITGSEECLGSIGFRAVGASRDSRDAYERLAMRRLVEDMLNEQAAIAGAVMAHAGTPHSFENPERDVTAVAAWSEVNVEPIRRAMATLEEIEKAPGGWTFAKLTIANSTLRELSALTAAP